MTFITSILCALALSTTTVQTVQDGISVIATLEPTDFTVGDSIELRIEASARDGMQLSLADDDAFGSFIVTNQSTLLDIPSDDSRKWYWSLQLDTFDAAVTALSEITLNWADANGRTGSIKIDSIPVQVTSIAGDALQDMELRDIHNSVPLLTSKWWPTVLVAGILLLVLFWATRTFFSRNKPIVPPHIKATAALLTLRNSELEVQDFYTTVSDIVRTYIEERFHIAATGQTTREFLIAEKENPKLEHCDRKALADFLVAADLVMFARFEPTATTWNDAIDRAEQFVSNTIPSEEPSPMEVAA